ncbi:COP1-interacting protein-related [Raphanus sativus]|nr:COP1-interacting protein-related [Raphanus sativus]
MSKKKRKLGEMETLVVDEKPSLSDIYVIDEKPSLSDKDENLVNALPSTYVGSLMDSPSEIPLSCNSSLQHAFSYPHEYSDADDSPPMGSPASWSSRMRKKWVTTTASHNNL